METADILSIVAIGVAVLSAAFTGWQARETARRNKQETEAFFRLEYVADPGDVGRPSTRDWVLWNSGTVDALEVKVRFSFDPKHFEYGRLALGTVARDERRVLQTDKPLPAPNETMTVDERGRWLIERATVTWMTSRNEPREQQIDMSGLR